MRSAILGFIILFFAPVIRAQSFLYIQSYGDTLTAIPSDYIANYSIEADEAHVKLVTGVMLIVPNAECSRWDCPVEFPRFAYYRFNSKQNDQLFQSVAAPPQELLKDTICLSVAQIGKSLTATFRLTDEEARAWVGSVPQKSKESRLRMAEPVTYIIGRDKWRQLQFLRDETGEVVYRYAPFGRQVTVCVDFLTDHPNSSYKVPRIDISTATGSVPLSKTAYVSGTITIDGGGVYPDMPQTDMLIKGRGNTSWSSQSDSKNPYHFKFAEKQEPLGMTAGRHWVLLSNKQTGSMMCNALAQKASALAGCAGVCHIVPVELYINGGYRGSYNLTERVGFGNNSVSIVDESCAAMLELDTYTNEPIWRDNAYNICTKIHEPDFDEEDSLLLITQSDILADWDAATQTLHYGGNEDYTGRFDVNYLVRYLFANELCYNTELSHPKSVFLYSENVLDDGFRLMGIDETPWIFGPMWDCDWSFGYNMGSRSYFVNCAEMEYYEYYYGGMWYDLRYKSQKVDKAYYTLWHKFLNDGRMQELIDYIQDYYDYADLSLKHDRENETSKKDATNYATIVKRASSWFRKRADFVYRRLTAYDIEEEEEEELPIPCIMDTEDGIKDLRDSKDFKDLKDTWYNLNGQMAKGKGSNGNLPKSIYITSDGRKVLLKP